MKRDMDLVRFILLSAEASTEVLDLGAILSYGCDAETAAYHVELMASYGLIESSVTYAFGSKPTIVEVTGITWEGYDYLDAIRSDKVWHRAAKAIKDTVGDTSLAVVKDICTALSEAMIKASLGI